MAKLKKVYWQIQVAENCRTFIALATDRESYQLKKMPFGMVNTGATFNIMMRKLLSGCDFC
jgi:hypothetical protein